uniref:Uncharacterized protein n=1 Tax=Aegilops tauschii subsp. strangulata TaxID=200361 RepID=A0A453FUQ2_AEGTS
MCQSRSPCSFILSSWYTSAEIVKSCVIVALILPSSSKYLSIPFLFGCLLKLEYYWSAGYCSLTFDSLKLPDAGKYY